METHELEIKCLDCDCVGFVRKVNNEVVLVPSEEKILFDYHQPQKLGLAKHGFATLRQRLTYLLLGTLFWQTIILIANFESVKNLAPLETFKTKTCARNFKTCLLNFPYGTCYESFSTCMRDTGEFVYPTKVVLPEARERADDDFYTNDEQDVNLKRCKRYNYYDLKICEQLCSKINEEDVGLCRQICESHLSDNGEMDEICPFEKLCAAGCPCSYFQCEHVDVKKIPLVWYYSENDALFELTTDADIPSTSIGRASFDASVDPRSLKLKKGRNYLVDAEFNTFILGDDELVDIGVESQAFLSRYGVTNRLIFNGKSTSIAAVFQDDFYFCSTIKYPNYCFFFDPLTRGRKKILEARGRIKSRDYDTRRHAFVFDGKLNILSVDSLLSHNIQLQRMESRERDWSESYYEDPLWEKEFRNDSHGVEIGMQITQLPYETVINDFLPIPDRKGVLFVATFRWREFEFGSDQTFVNKNPGPYFNTHSNFSFTKAKYFIIVYRLAAGRFVRMDRMETNFAYSSVRNPFYKDINAFEHFGEIMIYANSEEDIFRLNFESGDEKTHLERIETPELHFMGV
ncbi:Oidioi.mRNA.OKI2018_I69.chr2.g5317.t1.cds [Oikopleura dioica]|uniref:Oidioi.mRNA.OKI2018_I69.chr2.g5317.t1.cds n=1 Tax=Oikopleura dioica TaxID=34765 RepID=A0ABN7T5W6_OIKDI|nr:Oidioi.mRNA.OKI2018_I69.chr2.g5317.t1.cds [Oikopleura dioica]